MNRRTDPTGNLHINIIADKWDPKVEKLIEPFVYEVVGMFHLSRISHLITRVASTSVSGRSEEEDGGAELT